MSEQDQDSRPGPRLVDPPAEQYYRGTIIRVNYGSGSGMLRTGNGREVRFVMPFVELIGVKRVEELTEGMEVGFDLGWTARGLRVTKIRVY